MSQLKRMCDQTVRLNLIHAVLLTVISQLLFDDIIIHIDDDVDVSPIRFRAKLYSQRMPASVRK